MPLNLKTCKYCSMTISNDSVVCPYCHRGIGWWHTIPAKIIGGVVCLFFLGMVLYGLIEGANSPAQVKTPKELAAEARKAQLRPQFSGWDGSHVNLERVVKRAMNDPDSYEHVETEYWDRRDYLIVKTTFRGKNAFGGVVTNTVMAKVDLRGNVLEIMKAER